jgi:hypothetical protein
MSNNEQFDMPQKSKNTKPKARTDTNTSYTDPVTLETVPENNAWYITKDVGENRHIATVYEKKTLDTLLQRMRGLAISPMTRKEFRRANIKKAPPKGSKPLAKTLDDPDTSRRLLSPLAPKEYEHFITTGSKRSQQVSIGKRKKGGYRMRFNLDLDYSSLDDLSMGMRALSLALQSSTTKVDVSRTMTRTEHSLEENTNNNSASTSSTKTAPKKTNTPSTSSGVIQRRVIKVKRRSK